MISAFDTSLDGLQLDDGVVSVTVTKRAAVPAQHSSKSCSRDHGGIRLLNLLTDSRNFFQ